MPSRTRKNTERERMFILQELAATDPIICRINTRGVLDAHQQLLRIAPIAADEKEFVRAFLRQVASAPSLDTNRPFASAEC